MLQVSVLPNSWQPSSSCTACRKSRLGKACTSLTLTGLYMTLGRAELWLSTRNVSWHMLIIWISVDDFCIKISPGRTTQGHPSKTLWTSSSSSSPQLFWGCQRRRWEPLSSYRSLVFTIPHRMRLPRRSSRKWLHSTLARSFSLLATPSSCLSVSSTTLLSGLRARFCLPLDRLSRTWSMVGKCFTPVKVCNTYLQHLNFINATVHRKQHVHLPSTLTLFHEWNTLIIA